MFDILVYLFENYVDFADFNDANAPDGSRSDSTLTRKLTAAGFAAEEITDAVNWLQGLHTAKSESCMQADTRSLRAYTPDESAHLGAESLGFLHFLEQSRVLSASLRELVIERAMALPEEQLSFASFKLIVLMVLWSQAQTLDTLIVEELLADADPEFLH